MADRGQRLLEELLKIRLAHVDDVVRRRGSAKLRMRGLGHGRVAGRRPQIRAVHAPGELAIREVLAEQA